MGRYYLLFYTFQSLKFTNYFGESKILVVFLITFQKNSYLGKLVLKQNIQANGQQVNRDLIIDL